MTIDELKTLIADGETFHTELKRSPDKSLPSEVCAFANTDGGIIIIGVTDTGEIVGTDVSNVQRSRIQDSINSLDPKPRVDIDVIDNLIVLTVYAGEDKPYVAPSGFYIRSGPSSQKLERSEIIDFLQDEGRVRYDTSTSKRLLVGDNFKHSAYKSFLQRSGISNVLPRDTTLLNINAATLNTENELIYTNAGALFFRDNSEDVNFIESELKCILFQGVDKGGKVLDAASYCDTLPENIENAMKFLQRNLRTSWKFGKTQRDNVLEIPIEALREAVINAVCHQDYFVTSHPQIEIFDNRVVIWNPGGLPKGLHREHFGQLSIPRNQVLASLFDKSDYIEKAGTGITRIKNAAKDANLPEPTFEFNDNFFIVTFWRNPLPLSENNDYTTVNTDKIPINTDKIPIKYREDAVTVLSKIADGSDIGSADAAELVGKSQETSKKLLSTLVKLDILKVEGANKNRRYKLNNRLSI